MELKLPTPLKLLLKEKPPAVKNTGNTSLRAAIRLYRRGKRAIIINRNNTPVKTLYLLYLLKEELTKLTKKGRYFVYKEVGYKANRYPTAYNNRVL